MCLLQLTIGPNTIGGLIVEMVKLGFSFLTNSHAAFSANVLLALYPIIGFSCASSCVIGFQSSSEYECPGQKPLLPLTMAANEDVMTTLLTEGYMVMSACAQKVPHTCQRTALFLIDFKIPVVPMTAGSIKSCISLVDSPISRLQSVLTFCTSVTLKWNGLAV